MPELGAVEFQQRRVEHRQPAQALVGDGHADHPAILRPAHPTHQAFLFQPVHDPCHVRTGRDKVPGDLAHRAAAEPDPSTSPAALAARPGDRAAELVQRARALTNRTRALAERIAAAPPPAPERESEPDALAPRRDRLDERLARLYGARQTQSGALFVQPMNGAKQVAIAGDFNNWKPQTTLMKPNPRMQVWEACLPLPPGRYRYRLVVDDCWVTDPHNKQVETNPYGGFDNILLVE